MPRTNRLPERIGAIFLPEADTVEVTEDVTPSPERPPPLKQGCYTLSLRPAEASTYSPLYLGTLRVEQLFRGVRLSGDLYRYQPIDDLIADPLRVLGKLRPPSDEAAGTGGAIPIHPRTNYYSYLRGIGAQLLSMVPTSSERMLTLEFEEFVYKHPAKWFSGRFNQTPTRSIRFTLTPTASPDSLSGTAYEGTRKLGTVTIHWVSPNYRRAHLQIYTLQGAVAPPADVDGTSFATIFADAGWELSVTNGGTVPLPAELSSVNINDCWKLADMKSLMASVPGFNPADLDSVWRVHLIAIPAKLRCKRGRMFETMFFPDSPLARLGAATYSHDGYPSQAAGIALELDEGSPHYDAATDQQQHQVPRAYLRSAAHEVGHAFNQIHQEAKDGPDNSIMTTTPGVAEVLGVAGTFPDQINLAYNDRVKTHLRHLPDPAVRPGAMYVFAGAEAISHVPQAAEVAWLEVLELSVAPSSDRVALGEPITLSWTLTNQGQTAVPAPAELEVESLVARVSVTDPTGRVTFLRPVEVQSCPRVSMVPLEPGASVGGSTTLFWGWDGFAFEMPGRHVVEVIVLWELAGVPVAVSGERDVFVAYPTSKEENEIAALLLDADVGAAVAVGDVAPFARAAERIRRAGEIAPSHPANEALSRAGLSQQPS